MRSIDQLVIGDRLAPSEFSESDGRPRSLATGRWAFAPVLGGTAIGVWMRIT